MKIKAMGIAGLFLAIVLTLGLWPETAYLGSPCNVMAQQIGPPANLFPADPFGGAVVEKTKTPAQTKTQPAVAKESNSPPKKTGSRLSTTQAIEKALDTPILDFEYEEVPFSDVRRELEDKFGINIVLDHSAIDDALTEEELITVRLRGIKFSNALRLMLHDFNATYVVKDEVIRLISLSNVNDPENFTQRIVNVKSILQTIAKNDSRTSDPESAVSPESLLINTITSVVNRDQWAVSGKGEAAIEIIGGVLVIVGPGWLMEETTYFLKNLEANLTAQD